MTRQIVNVAKFLELCNQELRNHQDYEQGWEITCVPEDSSDSDLSGYTWTGPDSKLAILSWAVNRVKEQFDLCVTQ